MRSSTIQAFGPTLPRDTHTKGQSQVTRGGGGGGAGIGVKMRERGEVDGKGDFVQTKQISSK